MKTNSPTILHFKTSARRGFEELRLIERLFERHLSPLISTYKPTVIREVSPHSLWGSRTVKGASSSSKSIIITSLYHIDSPDMVKAALAGGKKESEVSQSFKWWVNADGAVRSLTSELLKIKSVNILDFVSAVDWAGRSNPISLRFGHHLFVCNIEPTDLKALSGSSKERLENLYNIILFVREVALRTGDATLQYEFSRLDRVAK